MASSWRPRRSSTYQPIRASTSVNTPTMAPMTINLAHGDCDMFFTSLFLQSNDEGRRLAGAGEAVMGCVKRE